MWDRNCFVALSRCFLALGFPGNWTSTFVSLPLHSRYADLAGPLEADEKPSAESVTAAFCSPSDSCHHSESVMGRNGGQFFPYVVPDVGDHKQLQLQ